MDIYQESTKLHERLGGKLEVRCKYEIRNQHDLSLVYTPGNPTKLKLARITNRRVLNGQLADAVKGADVFIGVSKGNVLTPEMVHSMADKPIIFAMANPTPEIMPEVAKQAGAFVVGTGRSDFPNQVNNVLAFPGIFRGALDARAKRITNKMKIQAAYALAACVEHPTVDEILPSPLDKSVAQCVARSVQQAYED